MSPSRRSYLRLSGLALAGTAGCLGRLRSSGTRLSLPDDAPDALRWAYGTAGEVRQPVAVTDDAVYVPSDRLFALNHDGTKRWSVGAADGVSGSPAVDDAVYFVDRQSGLRGNASTVRAMELDGSERWSAERDGIVDLLGVDDGLAYVNTTSDYSAPEGFALDAIDTETGEREWTAEVGSPSEMAVRNGSVYVASDRAVRAFATEDGTKLWERRGDVDSLAGVRDGTVVAAGLSSVVAFDADDGSERWSFTDEDVVVTDAAVRGDAVYVAEYDAVSAFDHEDGEHRWRSADHESKHYYLAGVDDETVFSSGGKGAAALDAATGEERWTWSDGNSAIYGETDGDAVYVSGDARLAALGTDGEEQWRFDAASADATLFRPSVSAAGGYVGSDGGTVYAFRT